MMVEHNQSKNGSGKYDNAYKFNGKELDDATGMYYYSARYYDPRISIFVSVDPLAENFVDWTPYHYVHNNPINLIDPTGMSAEGPGDPPTKELTFKERVALGIINIIDRVGALGAVVSGDKPGSFTHNLNYVRDGMLYITEQSVFIYSVNAMNRAPSDGEMKVSYNKAGDAVSKRPNVFTKVDYSNLKEPKNVKAGADFTRAQKARILQANSKANGGVMRSDMSGEFLQKPVQSRKGVPALMDQAEVDHIIPKSRGGTNSNSNAQVLSKRENLKKSNKP